LCGAETIDGRQERYCPYPSLAPEDRKKNLPKDPKRNIPSYQIEGGHLNEFEFQKSQSEMAEESKSPLTDKTEIPDLTQAERIAEVTAEAHKKVEKRKKRGLVAGRNRQKGAARKGAAKKRKGPPRKTARKSAKKRTAPAGTKKRANIRTRRKKGH